MTKPSEVTVSDEEIKRLNSILHESVRDDEVRRAIQNLIAARVPDAPLVMRRREYADGFKKCRDKVLKGV